MHTRVLGPFYIPRALTQPGIDRLGRRTRWPIIFRGPRHLRVAPNAARNCQWAEKIRKMKVNRLGRMSWKWMKRVWLYADDDRVRSQKRGPSFLRPQYLSEPCASYCPWDVKSSRTTMSRLLRYCLRNESRTVLLWPFCAFGHCLWRKAYTT